MAMLAQRQSKTTIVARAVLAGHTMYQMSATQNIKLDK
jgi:hypothetical protein